MFHSRTPAVILDQQTSVFRTQLDGVCDGQISFGSRTRPALGVGAALLVSASAILKSRSALPQERLVDVRGRLAG